VVSREGGRLREEWFNVHITYDGCYSCTKLS
jgi:hypothetical protein